MNENVVDVLIEKMLEDDPKHEIFFNRMKKWDLTSLYEGREHLIVGYRAILGLTPFDKKTLSWFEHRILMYDQVINGKELIKV